MNDKPWVDSVPGPMEYVPTRTAPLSPSPAKVAEILTRMIGSDWPTNEEDRRAWFTTFGLCDEQDVPRWGGDTEPGAVPTGWHTFRDEFVGVHWFLWEGWSRSVVEDAARVLASAISTDWGPSEDDGEHGTVGFTQQWVVNGRNLEMYFHSGLPPAYLERREMTPSVQLHVDHAQRAEAEEQHARLKATHS